ncbi:unnamed protein product [Blepharisma stoltei]|uniref:PPM-type phosphatase domain-containing protein n=1 Tax=Blepharisma stoltei TaxID=1481888 RepID=A0AAU9KFC0_9CILI|nr:unnamed protein product [Blepharisma stoltei]
MGNWCINASQKIQSIQDLQYFNSVLLKVTDRDHHVRHSSEEIHLPGPIHQQSLLTTVYKLPLRICGSVLPNLDHLDGKANPSMDTYAFLSKNGSLFCILFDGHGTEGDKIIAYCKKFMLNYFSENTEKFENSPKESITEMVIQCDEKLSESGISYSLSGCTAVVLVINSTGIHIGSVGHPQAVLATLPSDDSPTLNDEALEESDGGMEAGPYVRSIEPSRILVPIPLTVKQKPNHEVEYKRITEAGGIVERMVDELGQPIGPYRVWLNPGNLPGLTTSRTIGDALAKEIGVISTPVCNSFEIYPEADQFIVIASNGIWDVMDQLDVINFVEKFRTFCKGKSSEYPANANNSSIARLLCEEARYRWFGIVEKQNAMIDDISCIIIELSNVVPTMSLGESAKARASRVLEPWKSLAIDSEVYFGNKHAIRNDPARGSMTTGEIQNEVIEAAMELLKKEEEDGESNQNVLELL